MAAQSAHRDCNTTLGPQSACISFCHQLNNIYTALGAFWLRLPRSSLAALQSCSFLFFCFLGGEPKCRTLCGWEVPAERAGPSSLLYRLPSRLLLIYPGSLMTTAGPGKMQSVQRTASVTDAKPIQFQSRHFGVDLL